MKKLNETVINGLKLSAFCAALFAASRGERAGRCAENRTAGACGTERTRCGSAGWPDGGEELFIPVDGGKVFCHVYGRRKKGVPMIFLHGGPGGNGAGWFRQLPLAEDHPVVIYNQLGSAGSDFDESIENADQAMKYLTIDHYVDELQTVVDYFGFKEFMLVGRSWGTMLAVEYAAAKQPAGLKGMALSGPFLNVDTWCADAKRLISSLGEYELSDGTKADGPAMWDIVCRCEAENSFDNPLYADVNRIYTGNFGTRFENIACREGMPSDVDVSLHKIPGLSVYNYMWGPSEFSCMGTLKGHDSTCLLEKITVPVLYISGQYDSGSPEAAMSYCAKTPKGELCVLPGCGHNSPGERAKEYNTVVGEFAKRIS